MMSSSRSGRQHPGCQQLLLRDGVGGFAERCGDLVDGRGARVLPGQVVLGLGGECRRLGSLTSGGDGELVRPEQLLGALVGFAVALVGVSAELVDRVGDATVVAGRLGFDHHQRDAVDEQRHVGPNVRRLSRCCHRELRYGKEFVGRPVVPVDVVDGLIPATVPTVESADRGAAQQQVGRQSVRLQRLDPRRHRPQLRHRRSGLGLIQPRRAVRAAVDLLQRQTEPSLKEHITIRRPCVNAVRLSLGPDQRLPPQRGQMLEQRLSQPAPTPAQNSRRHRPNSPRQQISASKPGSEGRSSLTICAFSCWHRHVNGGQAIRNLVLFV